MLIGLTLLFPTIFNEQKDYDYDRNNDATRAAPVEPACVRDIRHANQQNKQQYVVYDS
jgi:hypothetical protein